YDSARDRREYRNPPLLLVRRRFCGSLHLAPPVAPVGPTVSPTDVTSPDMGGTKPDMSPITDAAPLEIAQLKRMPVSELLHHAEELGITGISGLRKQELVFRIEQALLDTDATLRGEGVIELLAEGYGFLRSQDWSYLAGPDDIYVSPSQIKRFDL